jgi:two-component system sensor histidine kinase DegS
MGTSVDMIASDLRPATLDHLGLVPAVQSYLKELADRGFPLKTSFQASGLKRRLPPAIELACYRIVQEALNNIAKHAGARAAEIRLTMSHPLLILMISDDGVGFQETSVDHLHGPLAGGLGLPGMKERAAAVGGSLEIRTRKDGGSTIRIQIPIAEDASLAQDEGFDR